MFGTVDILNPFPLLQDFKEVEAGKKIIPSISSKDFRLLAIKTHPLEGFSFPKKGSPDFEDQKRVYKEGLQLFLKFPHCCASHQKLLKTAWFKKTEYAYFPLKLLQSYSFTIHCINKCIDRDDWFKAITDYIEYTKYSFGQMPDNMGSPLGQHVYFNNVCEYIQNRTTIHHVKKNLLISRIEELRFGKEPDCQQVDLNLLITMYREWIQIFPFHLSFFQNLKSYFENQIPILKAGEHSNMYSGLSARKVISIAEMTDFLTQVTKSILKTINTLTIYEDGLLENAGKVRIEMIVAKRQLCLKKYETFNSNIRPYTDLLSDWLNDEKDFLDELIPVISESEKKKIFIDYIVQGLFEMQRQDIQIEAIREIKNSPKRNESGFRNAMKMFLKGGYLDASVGAEEMKGKGKIDLKVTDQIIGEKILEFKGWWNRDKKLIVQQICSYLTDANPEGFIVMINDTKHSIVDKYKKLITNQDMKCTLWKEIRYPTSDFTYYQSIHSFNNAQKTIFHFIFNVYNTSLI